jgi:hypothetical protein
MANENMSTTRGTLYVCLVDIAGVLVRGRSHVTENKWNVRSCVVLYPGYEPSQVENTLNKEVRECEVSSLPHHCLLEALSRCPEQ